MKEICAYIQPFMLPWVKRIEIFAPDELVKIIFDTLIQAAILITHSSLRCRKGRSYRGQQKREDKRRGKRKLELMQERSQTTFTLSASFMQPLLP
jgi:hypothetical protein